MPIQWSDTKKVELQGVIEVLKIVNDSGSIFNKIDGSNDIGIDGFIEFIQNKAPTGLCVGIQVKSGDSNITGNNETVSFKADRNHFEYWFNHILPIIAIVYIPKESKAYWFDLTKYLANNEDIIESGPYTIQVSKSNLFDVQSFTYFQYSLSKYLRSYGEDKFFGRALKYLVDFKSENNRRVGIRSLFSFHRDKLETWYYLITRFNYEYDFDVQNALIYAYRHLLSHGDIWWHPGNIIEENISKEAKQLIPLYFGLNEIQKLLSHINEEEGISRGTIGFDVNFIIKLIPNRIEILKRIILQTETSDEKRFWAAVCLINEIQYTDLERAIAFANSMVENFPKSENVERFQLIQLTLMEESQIDFFG